MTPSFATLPGAASAARQWHHLALLFADLSRSTALARRIDAEQMADLLEQFRDVCRRTVQAHGGQVARVQGDGMLAAFGYPQEDERAAFHAVEAAFDLQAAVSRLFVGALPEEFLPLAMHCGVHAGLVLVVEGDIERGRFDFVGDVPNSVERLCKAAGPGQVCVSVGAIGPARSRYRVDEALSVTVSPGEPSLPAYRLGGRHQPGVHYGEGRVLAGVSAFAGRGAEMQALRAFLDGPGTELGCATVSGEPGLGKSRLVLELWQSPAPDGSRMLRGYCDSAMSAETLLPFMQVVRRCVVASGEGVALAGGQAADVLADLGAEHHAALRLALGAADGTATPAALGPAVVALFTALARRSRVLLALEDWQWADDASRQVLAALLDLRAPLRIVLTSRERGVHRLATAQAPRIELSPLPLDALAGTLADWLPGIDPFVARAIHRQAGGVPLYLEELCHAVRAGRAVEALPEATGSTAWLDLLVESRLGRLPVPVANAVRVCSVLGVAFPLALMQRVAGIGPGDAAFQQAVDADFLSLRSDAVVQFKHELTRNAVYATIGRQRRRDWHARVFDLLHAGGAGAEQDSLEALAFHAGGAGRLAEHAKFSEHAGDKAMAAFALDRARAHFESALRAAEPEIDHSPGVGAVYCRVAAKLAMAGVFDPLALAHGVVPFERAVALAEGLGDQPLLARAQYWLGYICYAKGLTRRAVVHCRRALTLAQQVGDGRLRAQVEATLGQALVSCCRYAEALVLLDGALDSKRLHARPGSGMAIGSAYTLSCKGLLLADRGELAAAQACFDQSLELLGDTPHPVACSVRGWVAAAYLWQGRWQDASRMARDGERIADRAGTRHLLAMSRALDGYACWQLGEGQAAYERVRDATHWIEQRQGAFSASLNYGWLLDMAVQLELDEPVLQALTGRLLARARQGDRLGEAMGRRALARLAWRQGRPGLAEHQLQRAECAALLRGAPHELQANRACREQWGGGAAAPH